MNGYSVDTSEPRAITFRDVLHVAWATAWRFVVLWMLASFTVATLVLLFSPNPEALLKSDLPFNGQALISIAQALILMVALRQALQVNYGTFSLTVLGAADEFSHLARHTLTQGKMVRIWWAMTWPTQLVSILASSLLPVLSEDQESYPHFLLILALLPAACGLQLLFLWRALTKRYSDFRLARLAPWVEQNR